MHIMLAVHKQTLSSSTVGFNACRTRALLKRANGAPIFYHFDNKLQLLTFVHNRAVKSNLMLAWHQLRQERKKGSRALKGKTEKVHRQYLSNFLLRVMIIIMRSINQTPIMLASQPAGWLAS